MMTVEEALEWTDELDDGYLRLADEQCMQVLAAEVRRLREENSKLLASDLESCAKIHIGIGRFCMAGG